MEGGWIMGGCIGKGSFGTVSLAFDKLDGRIFAVKSVPLDSNSNSIGSLENEIDILRSLDSSCIVAYLGDSTTKELRHLHMEYVPGGTLADAAGKLGDREVRACTRRVVQALLYLHSVAGVVHSDVKGRNVLAGRAPCLAKLADFGSARRIPDGRPAIGGTPLWMAPEVVRGETPTPESDVWSLGCTIVEMVTGADPWKSSGGQDKLFEIGLGDGLPEFPDQLSELGKDFLAKCLRRNPAERWAAEQLLRHPFLADAAAGETGMSPRSVLDWASSELFDDDEAEGSEDGGNQDGEDVVGVVRDRISQLAETGSSAEVRDWVWDGEGWQVVRYFDEAAAAAAAASGTSGVSNEEMRCSSSCCSNCGSCSGGIGCQQEEGARKERRCLDLCQVSFHVPMFFILALQLVRLLYRFDELRFSNL